MFWTELLDKMVDKSDALISIYYGRDEPEEEAQHILSALSDRFAEADVELYYGGQPLYYYIFIRGITGGVFVAWLSG